MIAMATGCGWERGWGVEQRTRGLPYCVQKALEEGQRDQNQGVDAQEEAQHATGSQKLGPKRRQCTLPLVCFSIPAMVSPLQALQELAALIQSSSPDHVLLALPYWPAVYRKLALDVDRGVRIAANNALLSFVKVAGKSLAPELKKCVPSRIAVALTTQGSLWCSSSWSGRTANVNEKALQPKSFGNIKQRL